MYLLEHPRPGGGFTENLTGNRNLKPTNRSLPPPTLTHRLRRKSKLQPLPLYKFLKHPIKLRSILHGNHRYGICRLNRIGIPLPGNNLGAYNVEHRLEQSIIEYPAGELESSGWTRGAGLQIAESYTFPLPALALQSVTTIADHRRRTG